MTVKLFDKLKSIKDQNDRIHFLLEQLPASEKVHVEQFIIDKIRRIYAAEVQRDMLPTTD